MIITRTGDGMKRRHRVRKLRRRAPRRIRIQLARRRTQRRSLITKGT